MAKWMTGKIQPKEQGLRPLWLRELVSRLGEPAIFNDHPVELVAQGVKRRSWVWFPGTPSRNFNISIDEKLRVGRCGRRFRVAANGAGGFVIELDEEPSDELMQTALKAVRFGEE